MKIEASNPYHKQLAQCLADTSLIRELRGEVLLGLEQRPDNKALRGQLKDIDSEIAAYDKKIIDLRDKATAFEKADTTAIAKELADFQANAGKNCLAHSEAAKVRAPEIDKAFGTLLRLFEEQEKDLQAAYVAGIDAGIPYDRLSYLTDSAPLGVALADWICRGGWTKLPFLDVSNPRDPATVEQMTQDRHDRICSLLERAQETAS